MSNSILAPSLRRSLLVRTLLVSLIPLALLALICSQFAERIIVERFEADSLARAQAVATRLEDRIREVSRFARLVAEIQPTRDALIAGDESTGRKLLLPLKTRLGLDLLSLADRDGSILAAAQDLGAHGVIRRELTTPLYTKAEQSWMLDPQTAQGLLLLAAAPVRQGSELTGLVETGVFLDTDFLQPLAEVGGGAASSSGALIGLFWQGSAQAVTLQSLATLNVPSVDELRASGVDRLTRQVAVDSRPYFSVFSLVESHQATPAVLAVLLPLERVESARSLLIAVVAGLMGALAVVVGAIAYWSAGTFTLPLLRLARTAQRMENGDLEVKITTTSPHELGTLEGAFSAMAQTLQAREETLAALVAQLELRARSDELTGLPNRAALQERLEEALAKSKLDTPLALLLIDLDRFKDVNDTLGHQAGDAVLVQVARRFRNILSTSDTIARLGGDEFAVLLPMTSAAGAVRVAQKLLRSLEKPVLFLDRPLDVGASIGVATRQSVEDDAAALLRRADVAMYAAKRGRTGYACYTAEQDDHSPDRLALLGELRQAINANQLVLHFQPKVSLRTGRIAHTEALVRWQHPQHGLVPPDRFIPLAEQTGLISPLTRWVLDAALRQARIWRDKGQSLPVAVNVSVQNLHDPALGKTVAQLLQRHGVRPRDLIIEITETSVLLDPTRATEVLRSLRELGVRVAIDDFGAGQSALGYLKQLPADELKIDRSFVRDLARSDQDAAIVRAAIDLGHSLGLTVVAEGVEDEQTWDQLVLLGCDVAQGYYMSKPLTAEALDTWLTNSPFGVAATELRNAA